MRRMISTGAALASAALLAGAAHADGRSPDSVAGRYQAMVETRSCLVVLDAPSQAPEDSLIAPDSASGFAIASPGCPAGLDEAAFWRLTDEGRVLTLHDGAGESVFEGAPHERAHWRGAVLSGDPALLTRQ